jgi:hypothetical protein
MALLNAAAVGATDAVDARGNLRRTIRAGAIATAKGAAYKRANLPIPAPATVRPACSIQRT